MNRSQHDLAEDDVAADLRLLLAGIERREAARPAVPPPWPELLTAMRRSRRERRQRLLRRGAEGLAAVVAVAVLVGVAVNVVPRLTSQHQNRNQEQPADVRPKPVTGHSRLYGQPTRGSLAGDATWLDGLRARATSTSFLSSDVVVVTKGARNQPLVPNGELQPPAKDEVKVIFAGDVGAYRIALIEADWHDPKAAQSARPEAFWLYGARGAAPAAMVQKQTPITDLAITAATTKAVPDLPAGAKHPVGLVVVTPQPAKVWLGGAPAIDAQAHLRSAGRQLSQADGAYTWSAENPPYTLAFVNDEYVQSFATPAGPKHRSPTLEMLTPSRGATLAAFNGGDIPLALEMLEGEPEELIRAAGQYGLSWSGSSRFHVLASGRDDASHQWQPVVLQLTLPSGARIVGGFSTRAGKQWASAQDAIRLLPADHDGRSGISADASIAWVQPDLAFAAALGPDATASADWVLRDGTTISTPAQNTLAVLRDKGSIKQVRSVRFRDAQGTQLAEEGIAPSLRATHGIMADVWAAERGD